MNNSEDITLNELNEDFDAGEACYPVLSLEKIADELSEAKNALIITHVNPDGDCIGSAFALAAIIKECGGTARVVCPSPLPKRLVFLCGDSDVAEIEPDDPLDCCDKIISVDVASPKQLGALEYLVPNVSFMIDHHGTGEPFAENYVDPTASATGEIVYSIYVILKNRGVIGKIPEAARRIYAAIVSDTGSFKFSNTTPGTHIIASQLVEEINTAEDGGMDTSDVCRSLFCQRTLKELTAQMLAIQNLRFYEDGRLGAVLFTQEMLENSGLAEDEIGNVVETPRGVEGVLVGISLRQLASERTQYKVSSRANAEIDCASVCAAFGGGGHTRAAGCTITAQTPEEALSMMAEAFGEAVRAYGK